MISRPPSQCLSCKHWISPLDRKDDNARGPEPTQVCAAYPLADGGIPDDIWWNRADHRNPQSGDHGLRWESLGGAKFPEWAMSKGGQGQ